MTQLLTGFGNEHASEALPGALPTGRNSPQRPAYGLYAEQLSVTSFTTPRHLNRRSWLYRIRPSVLHVNGMLPIDNGQFRTAPCREIPAPAQQLRWSPLPIPETPMDFIEGMQTIVTNGDVHIQTGMAAHFYTCNRSMSDRYFSNADGEMLIVPQEGGLRLLTETGILEIRPGDISIIPRGLKFRVELLDASARGYVAENYGSPVELPELGPIGANALANPRDFEYAVAHFEDDDSPCEMVMKFQGQLHATQLQASPLDVVAWHGSAAACKYDLTRFCPVGAISFDHPDPSIYTVLTSRSETPGMANLDFVIFPERWAVAEDTFRPPWFHSNVMSEFMGLVRGGYDAKLEGFVPGGMSLHNCMLPHGPDRDAFAAASDADLQPRKLEDTLAFMFESRYAFMPTAYAMTSPHLQHDYASCWESLQSRFDPLNT